jgi:hypothetical protein
MSALALVLTLSVAPASSLLLAQQKQGQATQSDVRTFQGVIDQRGSEFVLANADDMEPIAILRGRGFAKENFARFVGDPVEVKGRMVTEQGQKILYVNAIADIHRKPPPRRAKGLTPASTLFRIYCR